MNNLDIVLPCYNPQSDWHLRVVNSFKSLESDLKNVVINLIVVNDGSSTSIPIEQIEYIKNNIDRFSYVNYDKNRGKGYALRKGINYSNSEYIIYTDIDFPYQLQNIGDIYKLLLKEYDVVIGVRSVNYYNNLPKSRIVVSKILKYFIKKTLGIYTTDTQCGLKGFNKKGKEIFLSTIIERYLFDLEFVYLASKQTNIKINSCIVELRDGVVFSKLNFKIVLSEFINFIRVFLFR